MNNNPFQHINYTHTQLGRTFLYKKKKKKKNWVEPELVQPDLFDRCRYSSLILKFGIQ